MLRPINLINRWTLLGVLSLITLMGIEHRLATLPPDAAGMAGMTVSSTSLTVAH